MYTFSVYELFGSLELPYYVWTLFVFTNEYVYGVMWLIGSLSQLSIYILVVTQEKTNKKL